MAVGVLPPPARGVRFALINPVVLVEGTRTVVVLRGEADRSTRPVLSAVLFSLIAPGSGDVVIDLAEMTFIDVAIGRVLAVAQQLLERQGRQMVFRLPSRLAVRVLHVFGLADLIGDREGVEL